MRLSDWTAGVLAVAIASLHAPSMLHAQARDTVRLSKAWSTLEISEAVTDSLVDPSGLAVDRAGRIYISDAKSARIWMLSDAGHLIGAIGRRGRGPGEFENPTGVAIGPDGALYVRDVQKVSRFVPGDRASVPWAFDRSFTLPAMADVNSRLPTRFSSDNRLHLPAFNSVRDSVSTGWYRAYTLRGQLLDSLRVPREKNAPSSTAWVRTGRGGGDMLPGLNSVPFAPFPHWDVSRTGTLVYHDGVSATIREIDSKGREVRKISIAARAVPIARRERAESLQALRKRVDALRAPRSAVHGIPQEVWDLELPVNYPLLQGLFAESDGSIWLQRWTASDQRRTVFDVLDSKGAPIATVILPGTVLSTPAPVLTRRDIVTLQVDAETGLFSVVRYRKR